MRHVFVTVRSLVAITVLTISWLSTSTEAGDCTTPRQYCQRSKYDLTEWDHCKQAGLFKSVSKCYLVNNQQVSRYDYYKCQPTKDGKGGFLFVRMCCDGLSYPTSDGTDVINRYDPATRRCTPPSLNG